MKLVVYSMLAVVIAINLLFAGCAKNASERRSASPTMSERISKDSVKGRVSEIGAKHVSIRDTDGQSRRVRVDDNSKMDQVAVGDQVKAYVTEDGYASTIQRVVD
jgi:hypothetical protein